MDSSTTVTKTAEDFFQRGLANGQALIEAYEARRSYLMGHPYWADGTVIESARKFASDVVGLLNVLRADARRDAAAPDGESERDA